MSMITENIQTHWLAVSPLFSIDSEDDYDQAIETLNDLIDKVGLDEQHPLYSLLDTLGTVIQAYEEKCYLMPEVSGYEMLRFFMDEHQLTQTDLPEVGSANIISEILEGKRNLTVTDIRALAKRFHISPSVFI